jgi:hypothetical protein
MNKDYQLVVATKSHIQDILKLTRRAFKEGDESHLQIQNHKMLNVITELVTNTHQFAVIAMSNGIPKGVMLGQVDSHAYCEGLVASDICLYVSPKLRGTKCCEELVKAYTGWCDHIPNLVGSSLSYSQLGAQAVYLGALYNKEGYKRAGASYIKMRGTE